MVAALVATVVLAASLAAFFNQTRQLRPHPGGERPAIVFSSFTLSIWRLSPAAVPKPAREELSITASRPPIIRYPVQLRPVDSSTVQTNMRKKDRFQMALSGDSEGYVYVFYRELFHQNKPGNVVLLFPAEGHNNRLTAGKTVAIPALDANGETFTIDADSSVAANQMIFAISSQPLAAEILTGGEAFEAMCKQYLKSTVDGIVEQGSIRVKSVVHTEKNSVRMFDLKVQLEGRSIRQ
jgi:hypothetical protein